MAETYTGNIKIILSGTLNNSVDLGSSDYALTYTKLYGLTNGTAADQANMIWTDTRTLTASSSENIDLAGVLTSAFGTTISFTKIKGIIISAAAANTNNVVVGGHATAAFVNWVSDYTDKIVVRPGGTFMLVAPDSTAYAVTATTGDLLTVANSSSGTSVTYDIVLLGTV